MIRAAGAIALGLALLGASGAHAASLQKVGSFEKPIYVTSEPGSPERLFVVERTGWIEQVQGGAVSTFADLRSVVACCEGERGLLSIALAPDFGTSGRLYVDYTGEEEPGEIHVAELRSSGGSALLASLRNLLTIEHPIDSNHNGGQLQFGPEGMLFVSTGDGGGSNDEHHTAQNLSSLLGKILRIDPNPSGVLPYTVPAVNPFAASAPPYNTIWSYGLRNPFRFSFDRLRGDLVIGDVGQGLREEADYAPAPALGGGADYGWNCREGLIAGPGTDPGCAGSEASDFVAPVFDYSHEGGRCAIIGGYVVRDPSLGGLYGRYLYGDLCTSEIRSLELADPFASDRSEGLEVGNLNSFGEDSCGRLYAISGDGGVFRLAGTSPATCVTTTHTKAYVGIRAQGRKVRRGGKALITAWVSPCSGRTGEPVRLLSGGHRVATRHLDRACTVHFRPRIRHRVRFRASVAEDATYVAAVSRRLKIRINHRKGPFRPVQKGLQRR